MPRSKNSGLRKVGPLRYGSPYDKRAGSSGGNSRGRRTGLREVSIETLQLNSGSLNNLGVLEFKLELNEHEYARFLPNPFFLKYRLEVFEAGEDRARAKLKEYHEKAMKTPAIIELHTKMDKANAAVLADPDDNEKNEAFKKLSGEFMNAVAAKTLQYKREELAKVQALESGEADETDLLADDRTWVNASIASVVEEIDKSYVAVPADQGLGFLFQKVEVFLDGVLIGEDTDTAGHNSVYQSLNRLFANRRQRTVVGSKRTFLTSAERKSSDSTFAKIASSYLHPTLTSEEPLLGEFTFDGTFGLSPPKNFALANLENLNSDQNNRSFFPPHSTIVIRLHPRDPWYAPLDWCAIDAESMINDSKLRDDEKKTIKKTRMRLSLIGMQYEKVVADRGASPGSTRRGCTFDSPFLDKITLEQGHQQIRVTSRVPAGSKLVYFCFLREHQLWHNPQLGKSLTHYFRFPHSLIKFSAALSGRGELFGKRGITNLGGSRGYESLDCRNYFQQIKNQGLVDFDFEDMFPPGNIVSKSLCQVLVADLRPYSIDKTSHIDITLDFDGNHSPETTKLICCYVSTKKLTPADNGKSWKLLTTAG